MRSKKFQAIQFGSLELYVKSTNTKTSDLPETLLTLVCVDIVSSGSNRRYFSILAENFWKDSLRRSKLLRRLIAFRGERSVLLALEELLPLRPKADSPRRSRGISVFKRPTSSSNMRKLGLLGLLVNNSLANSANVRSRKPTKIKWFVLIMYWFTVSLKANLRPCYLTPLPFLTDSDEIVHVYYLAPPRKKKVAYLVQNSYTKEHSKRAFYRLWLVWSHLIDLLKSGTKNPYTCADTELVCECS